MALQPEPGSEERPFHTWSNVPNPIYCLEHFSMSHENFWAFARLAARMNAIELYKEVYKGYLNPAGKKKWPGGLPKWPRERMLLEDGKYYCYEFGKPVKYRLKYPVEYGSIYPQPMKDSSTVEKPIVNYDGEPGYMTMNYEKEYHHGFEKWEVGKWIYDSSKVHVPVAASSWKYDYSTDRDPNKLVSEDRKNGIHKINAEAKSV